MVTRRVLMTIAFVKCAVAISCSSFRPREEIMLKSENESESFDSITRFDPKILKENLDAGEEIFLLDVRRPEELEQIGTIEGYHHIPISQLKDRMAEIPKGRSLVVF